jgi:hypothetical protein
MRALISVVLKDGTVMEGIAELGRARENSQSSGPTQRSARVAGRIAPLKFDSGPRPFMKKHGAGLSGPEKLILLVAYFARGKTRSPVSRADVVNQWGKMTAIMGGRYNGAYDTRARDTDWLHSPKAGYFELRPGWEIILK